MQRFVDQCIVLGLMQLLLYQQICLLELEHVLKNVLLVLQQRRLLALKDLVGLGLLWLSVSGAHGFANGVSNLFSSVVIANLVPRAIAAALDETSLAMVLVANLIDNAAQNHGLVELALGLQVFVNVSRHNLSKELVTWAVVATLASAANDIVLGNFKVGRQA